MSDVTQAIELQVCWKSQDIQRAATELVRAGLSELDKGRAWFGPDNIPADVTFDGQGIVGSAVHVLREGHVIEDYFGTVKDEAILFGRRRSLRESANGRKVQLYQLASRTIAETFLRRHAVAVEPQQREMAL